MIVAETDKDFAGSIPQMYERYLVPLIFEPYAGDLADRVRGAAPARVLELACGTGVATRELARALPADVAVVASDLNPGMLEQAAAVGTARPVEWRQADAMQLPFPDAAFDCVACQFGVMFFPDKARAFAEARRVLAPGGALVFSVWDRIEENDFAEVVTNALAPLFPANPPRFLARTPHGYHDRREIERDLAAGGFRAAPRMETIAARSIAPSFEDPAVAYCQGTPLRNEIENAAGVPLGEATAVAAEAIASRYGRGAVDGRIQAHVVMVRR